MIVEAGKEIPWFWEWVLPAFGYWLLIALILVVLGIGLALLFAVIGRGPGPGARTVGQRLGEGSLDLLSTSPRRVLALAQLAVKEAVRKKIFVVLILFVLVIAAATWFMDPSAGSEPARMYLDFVLLWGLTVPVLVVGVFLSAFSLPGDIANHTIYTVVTKPVRPTEIVLGRILGFTAIGSVLLLVMGIASYFFVARTLDHTHTISGADLARVKLLAGQGSDPEQGDRTVFRGQTSLVQGHKHPVEIDFAAGKGRTDLVNQHWHEITERQPRQRKQGDIEGCRPEAVTAAVNTGSASSPAATRQRIRVDSTAHGLSRGDIIRITDVEGVEANDVWVIDDVEENSFALKDSEFFGEYRGGGRWQQITYEVGGARGFISAKVPILAYQLQFYNRDGTPGEGINVGTEWEYRKSIEGETDSAAEFYYRGLDPSVADRNGNLKLQLTLGVFRTVKGNIESPIRGNIQLVHPDREIISEKLEPFDAWEYRPFEFTIPKTCPGMRSTGERLDATVFDDYVKDGKLILRITCAERLQYLTMAKNDVFFLSRPAAPAFNFIKGCVSIWLQLLLVVSLGVTLSTFLNGFVSLLAIGTIVVAGFFTETIREIADPKTPGGASMESFVRVLNRSAMTTDLPPSLGTDFVTWFDSGERVGLRLLLRVLPDLSHLSSNNIVSQGFSVPWNNLWVQLFTVLGFVIPLCLFAHYILKGREVAA